MKKGRLFMLVILSSITLLSATATIANAEFQPPSNSPMYTIGTK